MVVSARGWTSAVRAVGPILSYIQHLPMWVTVGLLAAFLIPPTLTTVVVAVGMITRKAERRKFCQHVVTDLSYRPRLPGRRPLSP